MANTSVSKGQRDQIVDVVSVATAKAVDKALEITGLQTSALQRALTRGKGLNEALCLSLTPYLAGLIRSYAVEFNNPAVFRGVSHSISPDCKQLPSAPLDIPLSQVELVSTLDDPDEDIEGWVHRKRLSEARYLCLNADHFVWHWQLAQQGQLPKSWKKKGLRILYDGTVFYLDDHWPREYILYLHYSEDAWSPEFCRIGAEINVFDVSAVAGKY
jgi:hypothetical protein